MTLEQNGKKKVLLLEHFYELQLLLFRNKDHL